MISSTFGLLFLFYCCIKPQSAALANIIYTDLLTLLQLFYTLERQFLFVALLYWLLRVCLYLEDSAVNAKNKTNSAKQLFDLGDSSTSLPHPQLPVLYLSELPSFLKTPMDLTIRTGTMARLECAAEGHPSPQIAWQKDGGTDFPAARERRMHVMPDDDIFFIANVKTEDMGVYSCTAQNAAGSLSANATLTVLGESPT